MKKQEPKFPVTQQYNLEHGNEFIVVGDSVFEVVCWSGPDVLLNFGVVEETPTGDNPFFKISGRTNVRGDYICPYNPLYKENIITLFNEYMEYHNEMSILTLVYDFLDDMLSFYVEDKKPVFSRNYANISQKKEKQSNQNKGMKSDSRVDHPSYYNGIPNVECIDVVRHMNFNIGSAIKYLWRAGLKSEEGLSIEDKTKEDIKKAIWYLQDYLKNILKDGEERSNDSKESK